MSCVSKVCLCSSNSTDKRGCSTEQMIQDTSGGFSTQGNTVIAPACSFTSFSLTSYGGKEDKQLCRQVFRVRLALTTCRGYPTIQPHISQLPAFQPQASHGGIHKHSHPLGQWNNFPLLTLCFPRMGTYISLWKRSCQWALVSGKALKTQVSVLTSSNEKIQRSQRQFADFFITGILRIQPLSVY